MSEQQNQTSINLFNPAVNPEIPQVITDQFLDLLKNLPETKKQNLEIMFALRLKYPNAFVYCESDKYGPHLIQKSKKTKSSGYLQPLRHQIGNKSDTSIRIVCYQGIIKLDHNIHQSNDEMIRSGQIDITPVFDECVDLGTSGRATSYVDGFKDIDGKPMSYSVSYYDFIDINHNLLEGLKESFIKTEELHGGKIAVKELTTSEIVDSL
jgi:hypothetical protein